MRYQIDQNKNTSAYMQLYEQLREDIIKGVYPDGKKLPSKRLLAEESGCSVITVEHAYAILSDEGYVEARERSGYFVAYRRDDFFSAAEIALPHPVARMKPSRSEFPFSILAKTMRRVLLEKGEQILVKSPNHGCPELRSAIAAYLARSNGMVVRPEQIVVGSGAEYLYGIIIQLLGRNRIVGLESPGYDKIRRVYEANGVRCELLKMGADGIKSEELARTRATVLHVTPFHSFPSGITAGASKRAEYLRFAQARGGYIVEDNYDSELTVSRKHEETVFSLSKDGSVIYLNTFSQTIAPSIRVGYMVLPLSLLPEFEKKLGFFSCSVPVFEQYVLSELLQNGDFERHINRVRRLRRAKAQAEKKEQKS